MSTKENDMKALKWRLQERPTADNVTKLVTAGIISAEQARQIILDEVDIDPVTLEDLQTEVKLLRKMVLELSNNKTAPIIHIIEKEVERMPYKKEPYWFTDYTMWCSTNSGDTTLTWNGTTSSTNGNLLA